MQIAYMELTLHLPFVHSLKDKRSELKSLKAKAANRFPISIAEADEQDTHRQAVLAVAFLCANTAQGDAMMEQILEDAAMVQKICGVCPKIGIETQVADLDAGMELGLSMTVEEMRQRGNPVHAATLTALEELKGRRE